MKIASGSTRIVLVFSLFVIKLPKMKTYRPIIRIFYHLWKRQVKSELKKFNQNSAIKAGFKYVFSGFVANRLEYSYSKKHRGSKGILPVYGLFFNLILIQKRADITQENNEKWRRFKEILIRHNIIEVNMLDPKNFGIYENKLKMIDYGSMDTIDVLNLNGLKLIENFY